MMKRALSLLTLVAFLAVWAPPAAAGEAALLCKFDELAKVLKITGTQRTLMERMLEELDSKLKSWDAANADRARTIGAKLAAGKEARDMEAICQGLNEQKALQGERRKLVDTFMIHLLGTLKPEQQAHWQTHILFHEMHLRFKRFKLDRGQVDSIRSLCQEVGKEIAALQTAGNFAGVDKVKQVIERKIVQEVLTPSQRELFAGPGGQFDAEKTGETDAERKERIRLAVMGWSDKRLEYENAKSLKSVKSAMSAAIIDAERRWREGINPRNNNDKGNWRGELMRLINNERAKHNLKALSGRGNLNSTAQRRADNLAPNRNKGKKKKGNNNKNRGNTGGPESVVRGPSSARAAFNAWMKNGSSRGKILSKSYHGVGLGRQGNIWVAKFGR